MALRRGIYGRLFSSVPSAKTLVPPPLRALPNAPIPPDRLLSLPLGRELLHWIRRERVRLDGLAPPPGRPEEGVMEEEARKVLRAAQMEAARVALRGIQRSTVTHAEFVRVCCDEAGADLGPDLARALDEAGAVIVIGDIVLLRPDQVVKAMQSVIPLDSAPLRKELEEMEVKKAAIDKKAKARVRKEMLCGLGLFAIQTVGFMRLTFWELSWDVMEPMCFFVTSLYFIIGYTFFLRTSRDPSFEGFFESRFAAKQKRLMRSQNFDIEKFNELKLASRNPSLNCKAASTLYCACHRRCSLLEA